MKKIIVFLTSFQISTSLYTQTINSTTGEYYLHGVMETASGFKLNEDSTFQFFFSYGALDRYGEGKWILKNNSISFTSSAKHEKDFALIQRKAVNDDFITIKIVEENEMLRKHVACIVKNNKGSDTVMTDDDGVIKIPGKAAESISLILKFCSEKQSFFSLANSNDNYFEFKFEPWIMEVFFENFELKIEQNKLTGKHPLLEGDNFIYEKE